MQRLSIAVLAATLLAGSAEGKCPTETVELRGTVLSRSGAPVVGASVLAEANGRLIEYDGKSTVAQTSSSGEFRLVCTFDTYAYTFLGGDHCSDRPGHISLQTVAADGQRQVDTYKLASYASVAQLGAIRLGTPKVAEAGASEYLSSPGTWFVILVGGSLAFFVWRSFQRSRKA